VTLSESGIEVVPRLIGAHRLYFYEDYDPIRALRGEVPGRLVKDTGWLKNLMVNNGKNLLLDRLFGFSGPPGAISALGIGTDTTAVSATQTQLNPSVSGSVYLQALDGGASRSGQVASYQMTVATGNGNFAIGEGAAFNGTTNGTSTMLNRLLISPVTTKTSAQTLIYACTLTQS